MPIFAPAGSGTTGFGTKQRGVTMIELVIVMSIASILALIAVPSLMSTLRDFRQRSAVSLVLSDLNHARSEAIKRNTRVLMCVRDAAGTGCATGTNWQAGWLVCTDADANDACDASTATSPNPVIVRPALDATLSLTGSAAAVRFNANSSQGVGTTAATLTLGGTWSGATSRAVSVAGTGYISKQ
ncbi:MAG: GspH/FimT family pseudopilin [Comamonadaceae bacterium]